MSDIPSFYKLLDKLRSSLMAEREAAMKDGGDRAKDIQDINDYVRDLQLQYYDRTADILDAMCVGEKAEIVKHFVEAATTAALATCQEGKKLDLGRHVQDWRRDTIALIETENPQAMRAQDAGRTEMVLSLHREADEAARRYEAANAVEARVRAYVEGLRSIDFADAAASLTGRAPASMLKTRVDLFHDAVLEKCEKRCLLPEHVVAILDENNKRGEAEATKEEEDEGGLGYHLMPLFATTEQAFRDELRRLAEQHAAAAATVAAASSATNPVAAASSSTSSGTNNDSGSNNNGGNSSSSLGDNMMDDEDVQAILDEQEKLCPTEDRRKFDQLQDKLTSLIKQKRAAQNNNRNNSSAATTAITTAAITPVPTASSATQVDDAKRFLNSLTNTLLNLINKHVHRRDSAAVLAYRARRRAHAAARVGSAAALREYKSIATKEFHQSLGEGSSEFLCALQRSLREAEGVRDAAEAMQTRWADEAKMLEAAAADSAKAQMVKQEMRGAVAKIQESNEKEAAHRESEIRAACNKMLKELEKAEQLSVADVKSMQKELRDLADYVMGMIAPASRK